MIEPYLALYISEGSLFFEKKIPTESKPRVIFEVPVEQIVGEEFERAAERLGITVLGIFRLWHASIFQKWGKHSPGVDTEKDNFATAMSLIDRFSGGTSEDRLMLIDELLRDASVVNIDAEKYFQSDWPILRKRLLLAG